MKAIVRRDTNEKYDAYLKHLAKESGIEEPTAEDARRMDRKRKKKKTSNKDWASATDSDARIARLKDGRTRLAYKPEHVTDLESGAIVAAEVHPADVGDTASMETSLEKARENILSVTQDDDDEDGDAAPPSGASHDEPEPPKIDVVADKGYHKGELILRLEKAGFRTYIPEPKVPGGRRWTNKAPELVKAVKNNRRRSKRQKAKQLHRLRGEMLERTFAHLCETGAHRRTRLRGRDNVSKRYLIHAAAANLGLVLRTILGHGTPRGIAEMAVAFLTLMLRLTRAVFVISMPQPHPLLTGRAHVDHGDLHGALRCRIVYEPVCSPGC